MAMIDRLTNIINLDENGLGQANNTDMLLQAEQRLRWYIGNNYDDIYKRSLSVTEVRQAGTVAEFYAIDHKLGYDVFTDRITSTGFSESTYNVTNQIAYRMDDNWFRIEKRYRASDSDADRFIQYVADDTGTVVTAYVDEYELAEAYLLASILVFKLKETRTGEPLYNPKDYGDGQIRPASIFEYQKLSDYYKKMAESILARLGYSAMRWA